MVAEREPALGHDHLFVAGRSDFLDRMPDVGRRQELSLLEIDHAAGARGGFEQVGLTRQKRRNLKHVGDLGDRRRMRGLVDVGEDGDARSLAHAREDPQALFEPRAAERSSGRAVRRMRP